MVFDFMLYFFLFYLRSDCLNFASLVDNDPKTVDKSTKFSINLQSFSGGDVEKSLRKEGISRCAVLLSDFFNPHPQNYVDKYILHC